MASIISREFFVNKQNHSIADRLRNNYTHKGIKKNVKINGVEPMELSANSSHILLYLHGFASGPSSTKAWYLERHFAEIGYELHVPDLNLGDFSRTTLSKQLDFLANLITELRQENPEAKVVVLGSSLGGLLAVLLAARVPEVNQLVLLAPAFGFGQRILDNLGTDQVALWHSSGQRMFYHYGYRQEMQLPYEFLVDALQHDENVLTRPVPTLIIHGEHDEVVPACLSVTYAKNRPHVQLEVVRSDHALTDQLQFIWAEVLRFAGLEAQNNRVVADSVSS
jgi:pimeloyl-ACP methyl ester carboxylesterase